MAVDDYYKHYEDRGFFFDRSLLTTYCLSLHTKPFVILSGISGTGKTKIAQLFSVPAAQGIPKAAAKPPIPPGEWLSLTVTDGLMHGDGRANFKFSDLSALFSDGEVAEIKPEIERLRALGAEDNIGKPVNFTINTPTGELQAQAYLQRASSPLLRARFKSKRGDESYDSRPYFAKHYKHGDVLRLEKVADKQLQIVSVNDQATMNAAKSLEQEEVAHVKNTCFISVRSDWTDSTSLFGYYNLVDQRFYLTPVLSFILKAKENPQIPFFLILDEMNLAKVEHYFSDFLSALESRYLDGATLHQEPLHLHSDSGWLNTNDDYFDLIGPTLELPSNLFVTGTVNVDESTYMFSSKVLDRANVIELNEVNIAAYGGNSGTAVAPDYVLESFPTLTAFSLATRSDFESLNPDAKSFLIQLHDILSAHHLQFGYRVINEISKYVSNALTYCEKSDDLLQHALDYQIVQKVLPKLNGPQSKLDVPVRQLLTFLASGSPGPAMELDAIAALDPTTTKFARSVSKLKRMSLALSIHGFANFIE